MEDFEELENLISNASSSLERGDVQTEFPAQLSENNPNFKQVGSLATGRNHRVTRSMAKKKRKAENTRKKKREPEEEEQQIGADAGVDISDFASAKGGKQEQEETAPEGRRRKRRKERRQTRVMSETLHGKYVAQQVQQLIKLNFSPVYQFASLVSSQSNWPIDELVLGISPEKFALPKIYSGELDLSKLNETNVSKLALYLAVELEIPIHAARDISRQALAEAENLVGGEAGISAATSIYSQRVRASSYDSVFRSPLFSSLFNSQNKMLLTPKFYGHLSTAFVDLKQINPAFKMEDLMFTDGIREQFSKYVSSVMLSVGARTGQLNSYERRNHGSRGVVVQPTTRWMLEASTKTMQDGRLFFRGVEYCGGKLRFVGGRSQGLHSAMREVFRDASRQRFASTQSYLFPNLRT